MLPDGSREPYDLNDVARVSWLPGLDLHSIDTDTYRLIDTDLVTAGTGCIL